ncbi:hypothetical protein EAF04_001114 [Stromatinia cepivora]|nr:hypothetical protein EAF04_001114 [Stromatinia cepivora]
MLPGEHLKPGAEVWPYTSLTEPYLPPLSLKEQIWLEDYGWNEFKALLVENGLDPHNIKHATKAVRMIRENGDWFGNLIPRLSEELAENNIVRQSPSVQDRKEEEVLRATPRNDDHAQQPIDSAKDRQLSLVKYAQNGEKTQKPERKIGLSVFVGNGHNIPYFVNAPDKEEQKKMYVKMVNNAGDSVFIEYEEDGKNEQIKKESEVGLFTVQDVNNGKVHSVRAPGGLWRLYRLKSNNHGKSFFVSLKRHKKRVVFYRKHGKNGLRRKSKSPKTASETVMDS